jgi:hypothetical protein
MSDANQRIKELQEKLKLQLETLAPRKAELEALSKAAYQEFSNAEEAERTCFSALLELKKKNRDFLQEKLMEQLDYQQRSEQIENEILRLTRRLKFIDLTIIYRTKHDLSRINPLKSERESVEEKLAVLRTEKADFDAGYQKMMSKYQISPECDLSKKYIDLIDITNEAAKNFQELHKETEAVRMTYNALNTTYCKLSIDINLN